MIISLEQRHDIKQAKELLEGTKNSNVLADKEYDSVKLRDQIKSQNYRAEISSKSNSKTPAEIDKQLYKERDLV